MLDLGLTRYLCVFCLSSVTAFAAKPGGKGQKQLTQRQQFVASRQVEAAGEMQLIAVVNEELRAQYKITKMIVSDITDRFPDKDPQNVSDGQFSSSQFYLDNNYDGALPKMSKNQGSLPGKEANDQQGTISDWADEIINVGAKVWSIIEAGRPISNQKMESANALPKGVEEWTDLQGWSAPISRVYSVQYENGFGITMVDLTFRVTFNYGGNYHGHGKYIANAAVQIESLRIGFGGIKFDVEVDVPSVFNQGSTQEPLAGMQLNIKRVADTIFSRNENTDSFFLNGLGLLQKL